MRSLCLFHAFAPNYVNVEDTKKGVPCNICLRNRDNAVWNLKVNKIIQGELCSFIDLDVNLVETEEQGNLIVLKFEESSLNGAYFKLSVKKNGYPLSLVYYVNKNIMSNYIKYDSIIGYYEDLCDNSNKVKNLNTFNSDEKAGILSYFRGLSLLTKSEKARCFFTSLYKILSQNGQMASKFEVENVIANLNVYLTITICDLDEIRYELFGSFEFREMEVIDDYLMNAYNSARQTYLYLLYAYYWLHDILAR